MSESDGFTSNDAYKTGVESSPTMPTPFPTSARRERQCPVRLGRLAKFVNLSPTAIACIEGKVRRLNSREDSNEKVQP